MIIKRLIKTIILLFWIISSATAQEVNYLRFTALENNVEIGIQNDSKLKFTFEYSINGDGIWAEFDTTKTITLPKQGDFISFRGENNKLATSGNKYANFVFSKNVAASGSVMSLISYKDGLPTTIPANYFFCKLFLNCSTLVSAPDLTAETLTQNCYNSMFQGCTSLEQAPNISATSYEKGCMNNMFVGCISLKQIEVSFTSWKTPAGDNFTSSWLKDASESGIFICPIELDLSSKTASTILKTWLVNPHKISFNNIEQENINIKEDTIISYNGTVKFKISNKKGYENIVTILGKNSQTEIDFATSSTGIYSFTMPNEDVEIKLNYNPIIYTITPNEYITCNTQNATVESETIFFTVADRTSEGYELNKVTINTEKATITNNAGSFLMSDFAKDVTIKATYTPIKYNITKDENISCRKTTGTVNDTIRFTIKDLTSTGYAFKTLLVNDVARTPSTLEDSVIMAKYLCDVKITTEYEPITYNITAGEYITCNTKTATVESEPIPFTVTDRTKGGYELTKVASGTKSIPVENYAGSFLMSDFAKDVNLIATYTPIKYNISKDDYISCSKTTGTVKDTIRFKIKDLTSKGYAFKTLFVNNVARTPSSLADSVIMAQYLCDVKISTEYEPINLNITHDEYITCNTKTATVESEEIPFSVADRTAEGYSLSKVNINTKIATITDYAGSFLMSDFAKDVTIKATYTPIKYNITKDENISCQKTTATVEDEITFTIKNLTSSGFVLSKVFVNSQEVSFQDYSASFKMADYISDVNISAEYQHLDYKITTDENCVANQQFANIDDLIKITAADLTNSGYELKNIFVNGKSITFYKNFCNFMMSDYKSDVEVTTQYKPITYKVKTGNNVYSDNNTAIVSDTILFTVDNLSEKGKIFEGILVNGQKIDIEGFNDTIFMSDYISDINIEAVYSKYNSITTDNNVVEISHTTAQQGDLITFKINKALAGYEPMVYVNSRSLSSPDSVNYSFSMFNNDVNIYVEYQEIVIEEPDTQEDNDPETEPEIIKKKKPTALNKVKTYPSLAKEGEIITISLENIDSEYLTDSKIIICNITGKVMKTIDNPQEMIKLTLPQGLYKGVLISGDKKFKFDFLITK